MKIDNVQITSVRKAGLTIYEFVIWDTEKCPLSIVTGAHITLRSLQNGCNI